MKTKSHKGRGPARSRQTWSKPMQRRHAKVAKVRHLDVRVYWMASWGVELKCDCKAGVTHGSTFSDLLANIAEWAERQSGPGYARTMPDLRTARVEISAMMRKYGRNARIPDPCGDISIQVL